MRHSPAGATTRLPYRRAHTVRSSRCNSADFVLRPITERQATAAIKDAQINTVSVVDPFAISMPPTIGPIIEPRRPMPSAQPTPVERTDVGYIAAATAFMQICPPTTPNPATNTNDNSNAVLDDSGPKAAVANAAVA